MKLQRLILALALTVAMPVYANATDKAETKATQQAKFMSRRALEILSQSMCGQFTGAGKKVASNIKRIVKKSMAKDGGINNATPAQIVSFLNKYKHYLICGHARENYMMVSFRYGNAYNELFNTLFFDELAPDDDAYIDVNAVSYIGPNHVPETLLDYLHREVKNKAYLKEYIKEVKNLIVTFEDELIGGKRYADLSDAQKAAVPSLEEVIGAKRN